MMPSRHGGIDKKYDGLSEDGQSWILKLYEGTPVPISEWLGYKISEACGIAVPYHHIVELPGGGSAFGSREEGGIEALTTRDPPIANLRASRDQISRIYALDLLISNIDRHPSNILWRKNAAGVLVPISIDFGQALFMQGLPLPDIRERECDTIQQIRALRHIQAWSPDAARRTLDTARSVKPSAIADWIDQAPAEWLGETDRTRFLNWWAGEAFQQRVNGCIMFCL